ncbi:MAG: ribosomal protein S18-alanine N-acetyltransferase [Lawsonibacter sp.]|nr:ribosomal protein S18-alanine N-acetyltransferase [Lawsonibacter sp.]
MEYVIVPMDRSHLSQIAALEQACFSQPWSEAALEEELYNPQASFIVAEDGEGGVLGYAGLQVVLDEGYICNVAVEPAARRHGVAGELLEVFCRFGQAHLAFLTLEVRASNAPAIALYRKYGFREAGRRKNFYTQPREDGIIMTREFAHGAEGTDPGSAEEPV